jgi:hypothetical protein
VNVDQFTGLTLLGSKDVRFQVLAILSMFLI